MVDQQEKLTGEANRKQQAYHLEPTNDCIANSEQKQWLGKMFL
jgi:hypothetical protein